MQGAYANKRAQQKLKCCYKFAAMGHLLFFFLAAISTASAQLTAQTSTAPDLRECYTNLMLVNRNNLPPVTIQVLIDIIQKIEDNPNINVDLRQLTVALLHTYRQDGMEYHQTTSTSANVLPYAPTHYSFYRHKLLLTRLLPNNLQTFGNETLPSNLKCALHYMLSTTVDARTRGDDSSCTELSQYRSARVPRAQRRQPSDVEVLDEKFIKSANKNGQIRQMNPNEEVESGAYGGVYSERQTVAESLCPLLGGVVSTPWGAVAGGSLVAGVAAGAQPQQVRVSELTKGTITNYENVPQTINNLYPATLTGDLAEAVLRQGSLGSQTISVGAHGGWNSTQGHKFYMLQQRLNLEMTDVEMRGDIDGFILGNSLNTILSSYSSLKLSQLLDMYYAPKNGAFNPSLRACNRREVIMQSVTDTTLANEAYGFTAALDSNMPLTGTITSGLTDLVSNAVTNLQNYISSNMNDVSCVATETVMVDHRPKTNLYLVLDATFQYSAIYPAISYLLDGIEVGKFGSSVTLLSALTGMTLIERTFSLADFHTQYTQSFHESLIHGVNLPTAIVAIHNLTASHLNVESSQTYVGGNSTVLLFLLATVNVQAADHDILVEQTKLLNETVPDLRYLFATSSNQEGTLGDLVRDRADVLTVSLSSTGVNVQTSMAPVLNRILLANRRVVNPLCGSQWVDSVSGSRAFVDFVEPSYVNYYSLSASYFFAHNENRRLRVERSGGGSGSLNVCWSRSVVQPRQNSTNGVNVDPNAVTCQSLASSGNAEIDLRNACDGYWTIGTCPPLYVSVESVGATATVQCTEAACRFPYNIRYTVQVQDLGCYSGSSVLVANLTVLLFACLFVMQHMF